MIPAVRKRLTYSNVIASLALFIALGGAAVAATKLPRNSVGPNQIKQGAVTAAKIRKQAVTSAKLATGAVTIGKLGTNSVGPNNIGNGAVTTPKLGASSVIASTIKNSVVTTNKLNNEAVTTSKLDKEAVVTNKLGNESVTSAKLGKGSVTPAKLSEGLGPLLGTLKSGQTLSGVFDIGDGSRTALSYQFPLLNAPAVTILKKGETSPACSGLGGGQTPQAATGNLCVYTTEESGTPALAFENNTRLGLGLKTAGGPGDFAYGQWAVTAP